MSRCPISRLLQILSNLQAQKLSYLKCYYCRYTPHTFMDCASMLYAGMEWNILARHQQCSAHRNEREWVSLYMPVFFKDTLPYTAKYNQLQCWQRWERMVLKGCAWFGLLDVCVLMILPGNIRLPWGKIEVSKPCHLQFSIYHLRFRTHRKSTQ
jgi:hypothetical protein